MILKHFGKTRVVIDLRPNDFGRMRDTVAKRYGTHALAKFVQLVRSYFHFAFESELIDRPIRYGAEFDKPSARSLRMARLKSGVKLIEATDVWKLHNSADPQLRAIVLLGLNCGYGPADCAALNREHLKSRLGWACFPRPKTGIDRRCPLWPETLEALEAVEKVRWVPHDEVDTDAVFLTRQGRRLSRFIDHGQEQRGTRKDSLSPAFNKLLKSTGVSINGGLYVRRHTFRTVADETLDKVAIDHIMGHADWSIAETYREKIADERLERVVNHVRDWLLVGREASVN